MQGVIHIWGQVWKLPLRLGKHQGSTAKAQPIRCTRVEAHCMFDLILDCGTVLFTLLPQCKSRVYSWQGKMIKEQMLQGSPSGCNSWSNQHTCSINRLSEKTTGFYMNAINGSFYLNVIRSNTKDSWKELCAIHMNLYFHSLLLIHYATKRLLNFEVSGNADLGHGTNLYYFFI